MERTTVSLRAAVAMCAATAVVFLAGVFAAHAWPGRPGVETRSFFTVAGTLTGVPAGGLRSLRFTFHKTGAADCVAPAEDVRYDAPNFSAQVPYEACGRGFFDGSDVSFDVAVNDTAIVGPGGGFRVNPVPYAQFASVAGTASTAQGVLLTQLNETRDRVISESHVRTRMGEVPREQNRLELSIRASELGGAGHTSLLSVSAGGAFIEVKQVFLVHVSDQMNFGACFSEVGGGPRFGGGSISILNPILDPIPAMPVRASCSGIFSLGADGPMMGWRGLWFSFKACHRLVGIGGTLSMCSTDKPSTCGCRRKRRTHIVQDGSGGSAQRKITLLRPKSPAISLQAAITVPRWPLVYISSAFASVFFFTPHLTPSFINPSVGFRCVIPR